MSESTPFNPEESEAPEDLARDIVSMQEGPVAAQDKAHVADIAGKLAALETLYEQREQRNQNQNNQGN